MAMQTNVEALIEAAQRLTPEERERLQQALAQTGVPERRHSITEIRGLGKDLWMGVDAQDYVNAERDSWDN